MERTTNLIYFETARGRRLRRARAAALYCFACVALSAITPVVLDAAEREQQWRADRLCRQGYYCDPKAGP